MTRWVPELAPTTARSVGLYAPTLGLPLSGSCLRTGDAASAATSPTCTSDMRDCLRISAREGLCGVRYVTADDVARCMEVFSACTHGGASEGGNQLPRTTTSARGGGREGLPQRFHISSSSSEYVSDCRVSGDAVNCTSTVEPCETTTAA